MMTAYLLLIVTVSLLLVSTSGNNANDNAQIDDIVRWLIDSGGKVSPKLEFRFEEGSSMGVYAKSDIDKGEEILVVPRSCYIKLEEDEIVPQPPGDPEWDISYKIYFGNVCELTKKVKNEMELGSESEFAPFVSYLNSQSKGQIPATWSDGAKSLIQNMLGSKLPPFYAVDWIQVWFVDTGCIREGDEHFAALTIQRGYDTALIPIWDLFNHHNSPDVLNTENDSMFEPGGMAVRASRFIPQGEQIFATYNKCTDCGADLIEYWGTPEVFRDFGFVEGYPQIWVFEKEEIWFEMVKDDEHDTPYVRFFHHGQPDEEGRPDAEGLEFLETELKRLRTYEGELSENENSTIPPNEWELIRLFYRAYTEAMSSVIEVTKSSIDAPVGEEL